MPRTSISIVGIQVEPFGVQRERSRKVPGTERVAGELGPERHAVRVRFHQALQHLARLAVTTEPRQRNRLAVGVGGGTLRPTARELLDELVERSLRIFGGARPEPCTDEVVRLRACVLPVRKPFRAVAGFRDAVGGDGMGREVFREAGGVARGALQRLEDSRHLARVESGVGQNPDTDPVRFHLVLPGEVDPALCGRAEYRGGRGVACLDVLGADDDGREDPGQNRKTRAVRMVDGPDDVALRDVRDFVSEDRRELALGFRRQDHPGVETDETARRGERIQRFVLDHEEREFEIAAIGRCHEAISQGLDVLLDQGIVDQLQPRPDLAHERFSECALVGGRECRLRRVAEIRQPHLRIRSAGETGRPADCGEQHQERPDRHAPGARTAGGTLRATEIRWSLVAAHEFLRVERVDRRRHAMFRLRVIRPRVRIVA